MALRDLLLMGSAAIASALPNYNPLATRIHSEGYLAATQLGASDSSFGILTLDIKGVSGTTAAPYASRYGLHNKEICSNIWTAYTSEGVPGINIAVDNAGGNVGTLRVNFADNSGNAIEATVSSLFANENAAFGNLTIAWSLATSGSRYIAILWNGVAQTATYQEYAGSVVGGFPGIPAAITGTFVPYIAANTRGFGIGSSGAGDPGINKTSFDVCRFLLDNSVDFIGSHAGVFQAGDMDKIWASGKPVDMSLGTTLIGHAPLVYHEGNSSAFSTEHGSTTATWSTKAFVVAQGDTAFLADASIPPTGIQDGRPAPSWYINDDFGAVISGVVSNHGCAIAQNDFLVLLVETVNASNVDNGLTVNQSFAIPTHTGLTMPVVNPSSGGRPQNVVAYTKVAAAGDVTANGSLWANRPTITTTTTPARFVYTLINMGQISGLDDMNVALLTPTGSVTPVVLPSVTASVAATKLLSIIGYYESKDPGKTTIPTGQNLIQKMDNDVNSLAFFQVSEEAITGTGSVGTRSCTAQNFSSGGMGAVVGISMLFKP